MPDSDPRLAFQVMNEVGIIEQLGRNLFQRYLPDGFLVSHFSVLNHLCRVKDGQTPLTIARAFQVPKTTMTHTLAGLEKAGLVEMRPNPRDGRSKRVWLTDAGREFRDDAISALDPEMAALAAAVPAERLQSILPALQEIRVYLDEARNLIEEAE